MNIDIERARFEKWANSVGSAKPDLATYLEEVGYGLTKMYLEEHVQLVWEGWQARAALLPSVEEIKTRMKSCAMNHWAYMTPKMFDDFAQAIRDLLEAKP